MLPATILIIDEAPEHRDVMGRVLRATGYTVLEASPGPDTLDWAEQQSPDLILINLSLPGQPGWETARQIRSRAALTNTPVLGTTVFTTLISTRHATQIGCAGRIDKPFDLDELLSRVSGLLPRPAVAA